MDRVDGAKGTPDDIVSKLNTQIAKIVDEPAFREKLVNLGFQPNAGTPEQLQATIEAEYDKWGEVVRLAGLSPN